MNPYLTRLREQYEGIRKGIEGLQTRAAEAGRDLSEDELRSVTEQAKQAETLATQIEDLTAVETRNAKVAQLAADLDGILGEDAAEDVRDRQEQHRASRTTAKDRDPGHYRKASDGGEQSFFGDLYRAAVTHDATAQQRLNEHNRALSTGTNGPGVVAPHWMTELFQPINRQGRALAARVNRIPLGDDPRPITVPKQTAGTDNVVAGQANENDAVGQTDAWDSDVDTVTPKPITGSQKFSRQLLDMANPAIDMLLYADLMSVYDFKVETQVAATAITAAGSPAVTLASEAADWTAVKATDAVIDASTAAWAARFLPPDLLAASIPRFGKFRKLKDTTGRPLMPFGDYGLSNAAGVQTGPMTGEIEGLIAVPTAGMGIGAYPEKFLVMRSQDLLLFESDVLRFRYEEVAGPQSIVLGVWGYVGTYAMYGGAGIKAVQVTAASA